MVCVVGQCTGVLGSYKAEEETAAAAFGSFWSRNGRRGLEWTASGRHRKK